MTNRICSNCGNESPGQFRYCGHCGAQLKSAADASSAPPFIGPGARRQVTVLFGDMVNYTRAASQVDPEAIYYTVRELFERLARAVRRQGGYIDRYVGDGFLAAFGAAEAHEDDPARALRAALEMQQIVADLRVRAKQALDWDWELRVGVNTGPAVRGQIHTGSLTDASVFGHTVNLACRLQQAAKPGTVLVSEAVYRRTRNLFDFDEPVRLQLKGLDRPVIGYELSGERPDPLPGRGLMGRRAELVGRQVEFESLSSGMQRLTMDGRGMIALVTGQAGIGKTRLVEDVLAQLAGHVTLARSRCYATEVTSYALLTKILESLTGILPEDSGSARRQRIDNLLLPAGAIAGDIAPTLYGLVGVAGAGETPSEDPQQQQRRVLGAIRRLFAWMARRQPMVLVLDDLQWADPSSLSVLEHISDLVTEVPLVLVAMARRASYDELKDTLVKPDLDRLGGLCDISLQPLFPEESELMLTRLLRSVILPPGLRQSIVDRGGGNPLLIEELVRMLLDEQVVRETRTGWQVEDNWAEVVQKVPETVNGLILSRFDRLPAGLKHVVRQAVILGPSFSMPLLAAMTDLAEADLRRELRSLEETDFLRRSAGGGGRLFFFRHALLQEAVYDTMLQSERKELHLRAAQAAQQLTDDLAAGASTLIGHHLEKADSPQAVPYLIQAAAQAADRYANQEAISCYQRAEALLDPDRPNWEQAVDLALGLAEMLARVNQLDQARETIEGAQELSLAAPVPGYRLGDAQYQLGCVCASQGDHPAALEAFEAARGQLAQAPIPDPAYSLSDIEQEVGWVMLREGKLVDAHQHAEKALVLAQERSNLRAVASAYNLLTPMHYWAGRLPEAVVTAQEALAIREQIGDIWGSASTQTNLAGIYHRLGRWDQAESLLRQAVFVRQEIGDHQGVILSANILGLLLLESGRYDEAMDSMDLAFATLQKQEAAPDLASQLYGNRGLLWLRMGEPEMARLDLEKCKRYAEQAANDDLRALALAYLAEVQLAGDELTKARELLDESAALVGDEGAPEIRAELLRARSLLLKAEDNWSGAMDANQRALVLYREIGNRYEVAHLQLEAAEIRLAWYARDKDVTFDHRVTTEVLEALQVYKELPARALVPAAEETLARVSVYGEQIVVGERTTGHWPVVLVYFKLGVPSEVRSEGVLMLADRLKAELRRLGRSAGAAVVDDHSDLIYLISERDPGAAQRLARSAIQAGHAASDVAIRYNRLGQRQYDTSFHLTTGIVAGRWEGSLHDREEVAEFVRTSPIGRQAASMAATPGEDAILVSGQVAENIKDVYELDPIEHAALLGPAYRLGRPRAEIGVPQTLPGSTSRLIGRGSEVEALRGWIDGIRTEPEGRVCYMEAKAGMGKTRLVEEVLAYAQPEVRCLLSKCEYFRANISFWPLIDMLEQGDYPDTAASRRLKGLLALRPADDADDALLHNIVPGDLRRELFGRLRTWLLELASEQPLLLVMEDVHYIDLSSLDLVDFLLPLTFEGAISVMLVARAEMPGPHRALVSQAERVCDERYLRVSFEALPEPESRALIQDLLETPELPDQLWQLVEPFAGHPLSLEEALRFLIERGWLWRVNGRWQMSGVRGQPGGGMPATFRDLVLGRLDRLDKETLHVFQAAAVMGEYFDRTVLGRVVPRPALSRRLTELVDRGWLILPVPAKPHLYRFKHTLTRETIYATLLTSKRQLIHQRAGESIRALYPEAEEEHVELLAHHFAQSSLREEALHYLLRAAEKSAARYALAESLSYFTQAAELLASLSTVQPRLVSRIALGLADVHLLRGEPASASSRVMPLVGELPEGVAPGTRAAALRRLAEARREMGDLRAALDYYQQALAILEAAAPPEPPGDDELWATQLGVAQTLFDMRENRGAQEQGERVLNALDQRTHPRLAAETLNLLGGVAYRQGDTEIASRLVQQSLTLHQQIGNRNGAASDYSNLGILAAANQELDRARDFFLLGLEMHQELGDGRGTAIIENNLGLLERNCGRFREAIEHLERGVQSARLSELTQVLAQSLANLGQAQALAGRPDEGLASLDEAESLCEGYGYRNLLCEVYWKRADILVDRGELVAAEKAALAARKLATELSSQDLKSEAQRALARAYRRMGRLIAALDEAGAAWGARAEQPRSAVRARFAAEYALALLDGRQSAQARQLLLDEVAPVTLYESAAVMGEINAALALVAPAA